MNFEEDTRNVTIHIHPDRHGEAGRETDKKTEFQNVLLAFSTSQILNI